MYAVNVLDWQAHKEDLCLKILLAGNVDETAAAVVDAEPGRVDGMALPLTCDDERARAIVATIRKHYHKNQLRLYRGSSRTWKRV